MALASFLTDTSAVHRIIDGSKVPELVLEQLQVGLLAICEPVELEVLRSSRSAADYDRARRDLSVSFTRVSTPDLVWRRAADVQTQLVRRGTHRSARMTDLVVAATAEVHGLTLLHGDRDYECIAAVTGQATRQLAA